MRQNRKFLRPPSSTNRRLSSEGEFRASAPWSRVNVGFFITEESTKRALMVMSHLFILLALLLLAATALSAQLDAAPFAETQFDFIIVGGGTAGVTVAVRWICLSYALVWRRY